MSEPDTPDRVEPAEPAAAPAEPGAAPQPAKPTRLDRRRARTRRALLDAARAIMAERGTSEVSIQEITERADVGFGSFYNHFSSKTEVFEAAVAEVLEEHGRLLDDVTSGIEDPAEVFAVAVRATAHLAAERPAVAQVLVRAGLDYLVAADGLAPRALRDVERAVAAGRFTVRTPFLAVVSTAGCLMAYLHVRLNTPDLLDRDAADELAESLLRMLGMEATDAHEIARRPLPAPLDGV
jgi:AcrR family transcriptional regulator